MANTTNLNLEKPIGTDQALVSVINSNMDKIDTFAGSTNQAITNINNKMRIISTGSLHDIRTAGIYWLTSAVADKPDPGAGIYVVNNYGNDYISGTYTAADSHKMYTIGLSGGTWTYTELALKSDVEQSGGSYTPTISAGSGFAVENVNFTYRRFGKILLISGRFNVTNAGATNSNIVISLPTGFTAQNMGVGSCGGVYLNKAYTGIGLSLRCDGGSTMFIQSGAGGYSTQAIGTGYVIIDATVMLA